MAEACPPDCAPAPVTRGGRLLAACEARGWQLRIDHRGNLLVDVGSQPCPDLMAALRSAEAEVVGALLVRGMRASGGPAHAGKAAHGGGNGLP